MIHVKKKSFKESVFKKQMGQPNNYMDIVEIVINK